MELEPWIRTFHCCLSYGRPLEPWAQRLGYTPSLAAYQNRPYYVMPAAVEWVYRLPVEEDEPFELGPLPTDLALDENDNLEAVHFFTTIISPPERTQQQSKSPRCYQSLYDGPLSKKELDKGGDIGLGTGPPRVTNWRLTWDTNVEDQMHVMVVLYGLREVATAQSLANDSNHPRRRSEEDLGRMVYEWMVSEEDPSRIEDRMRVCELISPQFKEPGFRSAMRMFFKRGVDELAM